MSPVLWKMAIDNRVPVRSALWQDSLQPRSHESITVGRYLVAAIDQVKLDVGRTTAEPLRIMLGNIRWIVFVLAPRNVHDGRTDGMVGTFVPITRQAAARRRSRSA